MPTVLRVGGFQFIIFTSDHPPAHVHVRHGGKLAKVNLLTMEFERTGGYSASDQRRVLDIVHENHELLVAAWSELYPPEESEADEH